MRQMVEAIKIDHDGGERHSGRRMAAWTDSSIAPVGHARMQIGIGTRSRKWLQGVIPK